MITKICSFRSSLAEHLAPTNSFRPCKDILFLIMRQAMQIQQELETWADSLPLEWKPTSILGSDRRSLVTYSTQWLGVILTMYHASLILFYHSVLRCSQSILNLLSTGMAIERELTERSAAMAGENLTHMISVICDSISSTLGEVDNTAKSLTTPTYKGSVCHTLIWPLVLVTVCPNSTEDQVRVCKKTLASTGMGMDVTWRAYEGLGHSYRVEDEIQYILRFLQRHVELPTTHYLSKPSHL